ncbi:MAG: DUF1501 domain-containing protein, partial [Planctomycetota bacterium]|nr:DUF1501 domain-containing protein [Planctomycetota bacterium]
MFASGGRTVSRCCPGRQSAQSRRDFLQHSSMGFGWLALSGMLQHPVLANERAVVPHLFARAKHVIFLFMDGGVSHVDSYDPKPE